MAYVKMDPEEMANQNKFIQIDAREDDSIVALDSVGRVWRYLPNLKRWYPVPPDRMRFIPD